MATIVEEGDLCQNPMRDPFQEMAAQAAALADAGEYDGPMVPEATECDLGGAVELAYSHRRSPGALPTMAL
jgi:hypothetical protein